MRAGLQSRPHPEPVEGRGRLPRSHQHSTRNSQRKRAEDRPGPSLFQTVSEQAAHHREC
ncbi:hypothetical protein [Caulobacter vibrioides]|uniref:Uncharacterized protein n=1 Tax=Caulobacter vibrioides (strain NA1000 / CB15N) TaxID=565050 RepID=A0A0H3C7F0_CAUVN|nr:hypothetical protein [Caulobacter vibrioides]YP_002516521.1 hypothetical protein CCNA_01148 [Caulobacter vibrioides NA1000]ACL94613.1 hypothetical protein CCNA_01148 [Caulobacter vibrioides NA1000]AVH77074.1 hypothetical protein CA607_20350 [Caulobacter vibrioides]QXZ53173.1 hypothetical protein KZH45_05735 [Caulobacter vibrioides]